MKKIILLFSMTGALLAAGCKRNSNTAPATIYRGVVLCSICTQTVIQTIGPNYLGENGWIDINGSAGTIRDHVFKVQNGCQVAVKQGDTINFKVISPQVEDCIACMIAVSCPQTLIPIQVVN